MIGFESSYLYFMGNSGTLWLKMKRNAIFGIPLPLGLKAKKSTPCMKEDALKEGGYDSPTKGAFLFV
jgi:hypothetical protein